MNYIGALAIEGKHSTTARTNGSTRRSNSSCSKIEGFDQLTSLVSNVVDKETQEKNRRRQRPADQRTTAYCDVCATDVLNYVASIFARGDAKE